MAEAAPLHCLVYVSKIALSERAHVRQTVLNILTRSQHLNARDNITGVLVFNQLFFAQALEGDRDSVDRTFARISKDTRHTLPALVLKRAIPERSFANWTMCARQLSKLDSDILDQLEQTGAFPPPIGSGVLLLEQLKDIGRAHQAAFDLQMQDVANF
ncbi:MAG: BLUF domain-containing protein [Caulobacterales bacterium]